MRTLTQARTVARPAGRKTRVIAAVGVIVWALVLAYPRDVAPPVPPPRAVPSDDPWMPRGIVARGIYAGWELDTNQFRSAALLTPQQAAPYQPAAGEILLANFRHADQWFIARIRPDQIADLVFHLELIPNEFPGVHNQLRIVMKEGAEVTLLPQRPGDSPTPVRLRNLVLSSEGNWAPGSSFNWRGGPEQQSIAHMAMSMDQKAHIMSGGPVPHDVHQVYLQMDAAKKRDVVMSYLTHATRVGTDEMFNLGNWNCASPLFNVLDRTLDYGPLRNGLAALSPSSIPHWSLSNIAVRGILDRERPLPSFFDEFPYRTAVP